MPKAVLAFVVALLASSPAFAAKRLTVEELSREVASFAKKNDSKVAGQLYGLQLTERLNAKKLGDLEAALPGPDSRRALVALADQAEFLDPSPADIPNQPPPSVAEQRAIIAKSINYAEAVLRRLPNLYARQDTIRYADTPAGVRSERTDTIIPYQPLHPVSRSVETVLYRDGREVFQKKAGQEGGSTAPTSGMITFGEFGALFPVLYGDLPKGNLRWGYWEQGKSNLEAVFRFNVPKADSHYLVRYCCISGSLFKQFPAYHGEITINPSKGTILRITLVADMAKDDPLTKAELMVEYEPVELGEKKYFCPIRSVSVSRTSVQWTRTGTGIGNNIRGIPLVPHPDYGAATTPLQTMLNETTFDRYHLFRADVQILTANNGKGEAAPTAGPRATPEPGASSSAAPTEQANAANEDAGSAPAPAGTVGKTEASNASAAKSAAPPVFTPQLNAMTTAPSASPSVAPGASGASANAEAETSSPAEAKSTAPPPAASAATTTKPFAPEMAEMAPVPPRRASGKSGFSLSMNARLVDLDLPNTSRIGGRPVRRGSLWWMRTRGGWGRLRCRRLLTTAHR